MARHLNLLPPERRANLRRGALMLASIRILRLFAVGLGLVTIGGGGLIITMRIMTITFSDSAELGLQKKVSEFVQLSNVTNNQNHSLRIINQLGEKRVIWSDHISSFLSTVPPGAKINTLSSDTRVGVMSVAGEAPSRNTLVVFEDKMKKLPWVQGVSAPRQNLLQKDNPSYTFDISLTGYEDSRNGIDQ